jgi:hypothetical protein
LNLHARGKAAFQAAQGGRVGLSSRLAHEL